MTYGGHGGDKCAAQLRQVAGGLKLRAVDTMPAVTVSNEAIVSDEPQSDADLQPFEASVQQAFAELSAMLGTPSR